MIESEKKSPLAEIRRQLRERWNSDPVYVRAREKLQQAWRTQKNTLRLDLLLEADLPRNGSLLDARGFNFNRIEETEGPGYYLHNEQPAFWGGALFHVDFSFSRCKCMDWHGLKLEGCNFADSELLGLTVYGCELVECDFDRVMFSYSSLGQQMRCRKCSFNSATFEGRNLFDEYSHYDGCSFRDTSFREEWLSSITFENCTMECAFKNSTFAGKKQTRFDWSLSGIDFFTQMLKKNRRYPATFINTDLSKCQFKNVTVFDGAVFINSPLPAADKTPVEGGVIFQNMKR